MSSTNTKASTTTPVTPVTPVTPTPITPEKTFAVSHLYSALKGAACMAMLTAGIAISSCNTKTQIDEYAKTSKIEMHSFVQEQQAITQRNLSVEFAGRIDEVVSGNKQTQQMLFRLLNILEPDKGASFYRDSMLNNSNTVNTSSSSTTNNGPEAR